MQIGTDLLQISEFKNRLKDASILEKIFLPVELEQNIASENLAGVFAAKEAFFKAMGTKLNWLDVRIEKKSSGKPELFSRYLGDRKADVSISHSGDYAVAMVIIED